MKHLQLTTKNYKYGSYYLKDFKGHILFRYFNFKGILFDATNPSYTFFKDDACEDPHYKKQAIDFLLNDCQETYSLEEIYDYLSELRPYSTKRLPVCPKNIGLDQEDYLYHLLKTKKAVLLYCENEEEYHYYENKFIGKVNTIYNLAEYLTQNRLNYSKIRYDQTLQELVNQNQMIHIYVGEYGLMSCKDLAIDSFVYTMTSHFYNQMLCTVFEPQRMRLFCKAGSNMIDFNPFISQGTLSYGHLDALYRTYGDHIFTEDYQTLYLKYPSFFSNFYHVQEYKMSNFTATCLDEVLKEKRRSLEDACKDAITLRTLYVNEKYKEVPLDLNPKEYTGNILVDVFALEHCSSAKVHFKAETEKVRDVVLNNKTLVTNFLFYSTKKVIHWYNEFRETRQQEQLPYLSEHIDYMYRKNEYEDFPLYHKSAIAKKKDGTLDIIQTTLKGGKISFMNQSISWTEEHVNKQGKSPVIVYTPMAVKDLNTDYFSVKKEVGQGRVNLIIVKNRLICIRQGDVILPSIGVVVSLTQEYFESMFPLLTFDQEGYCVLHTTIKIELENPTSVTKEEFATIDWIYGGAMKIYDQHESSYLKNLEREGWMNSLSCQTQESQIHLLSKHPRTVMFRRKGIIYMAIFSGRSKVSVGADYQDIIQILTQYYDDIEEIINMDGGASSVGAYYVQDQWVEYTLPCSSLETPAGKIREINAMLCIEW